MKQLIIGVILAFITWNGIVFMLYWLDKCRARNHYWRISEKTLIAAAFFMGGLGAALGMKAFHHKTKQLKFKILIPLAFICNIALIAGAVYLLYIRRQG